jgi:hypothetical protein
MSRLSHAASLNQLDHHQATVAGTVHRAVDALRRAHITPQQATERTDAQNRRLLRQTSGDIRRTGCVRDNQCPPVLRTFALDSWCSSLGFRRLLFRRGDCVEAFLQRVHQIHDLVWDFDSGRDNLFARNLGVDDALPSRIPRYVVRLLGGPSILRRSGSGRLFFR